MILREKYYKVKKLYKVVVAMLYIVYILSY